MMLSVDIPEQSLSKYTKEEDAVGLQDDDSRINTTFVELRHHCLELLDLLQIKSTVDAPSAVASLFQFLKSCPSSSLQPFFDYTVFPLLLLLDMAVNARKLECSEKNNEQVMKLSDQTVEGGLHCLEELILKCRLTSTDQLIVLMKKLARGAMLSTAEASEEFREGVIRCFKALIINLYPCGVDSCSCNILGVPALMNSEEMQSPASNCLPENEDCLISFVQSESAAPAVGHWFSLLLKAADSEAKTGHRGSARLRREAFLTLRVLVAKIGKADALAFFLPGVVSQLGKVMHISNKRISGAAGNADANSHAIKVLAEYLMIVLKDDANPFANELNPEIGNKFNNANSALDALRHLQFMAKSDQTTSTGVEENKNLEVDSEQEIGRLHVEDRSGKWLHKTTHHVNKLLNATFPPLCSHPAKKVRLALFSAIKGLLINCNFTLQDIKPMLLESLYALIFDDSPEISTSAKKFLDSCFIDSVRCSRTDITVTYNRLVEKLPKVALSNEDALAISAAQQLLTVVYFAGPSFMLENLQSPVMTAQFLDVISLCLGHNTVYSGCLDKHLTQPFSISYIPSINELKDFSNSHSSQQVLVGSSMRKPVNYPENIVDNIHYELPCTPPWLVHSSSPKLYQSLSGILRLVGLALTTEFAKEKNLSLVMDIPLNCIRNLVSELRVKQIGSESWFMWYKRTGNGELMRQTSTAISVVNEIIFGTSEKAFHSLLKTFSNSESPGQSSSIESPKNFWSVAKANSTKTSLINCIGGILHEYLSLEIWNTPQEGAFDNESKQIILHFSRDAAMIQQVIIEGIGIFALVLGKDFASSGFLQLSLYLLLEVLTFSTLLVARASDAVLHVIASVCGFSSVGELVVANADYVIDSICRQLRNVEMNTRSPNVLASMLSYIGVAQKILPLLAEPMRYASLELEILGRNHHPQLTLSFLKVVDEISKAAKREAFVSPEVAHSFYYDVRSNALSSSSEESEWETFVLKLCDARRYRRIVASVATSSLSSATPLVTSSNPNECLTALSIFLDGLSTLAKVEEAFRLDKETFDALEKIVNSRAFHRLHDVITTAEDSTDENFLLPAMNKIWPFLITCIRTQKHIVLNKCLEVLPKIITICGGDFFTRRFYTDGGAFWKLLSSSPFHIKPFLEKSPLLLPFRASPLESEEPMAESSNIKVQVGVLDMISALSRDSRSCFAMGSVFKKVCGLVVGLVCTGISGLRNASVNALLGLSSLDPDLTWLLVADVHYSLERNEFPSPPSSSFPEGHYLLPRVSSSKDYLFVQYGGQTFGFDVDFAFVGTVFKLLSSPSN